MSREFLHFSQCVSIGILTFKKGFSRLKMTMIQAKDITVQKYGGTSVGSVERILNVAKRVKKFKETCPHMVIVVSAMGKTTDDLVKLCHEVSTTPDPREYDALVSTGENISASLLSMALHGIGVPAISLTGQQAGVITSGHYGKSKIVTVNNERVMTELTGGKVVVVTGFQGINQNLDVTTIGRGGSDTSAVVLAAALGVKVCDICTDVDGVYTTDPRKVENAKKISEISYDEMLELAALGAGVLHPRAVECAKENGIILHVRSSFKEDLGTYVKEMDQMEVNKPVTGVTLSEDVAQITITGLSDSPGIAGKLFTELASESINVDMIIQTTGEHSLNEISFTVDETDVQQAYKITQSVAEKLKAGPVTFDTNVAKVSIVGVGMMTRPGVAATFFETLGVNKINIGMITTSEIKVSCVVNRQDGRRSLELLHSAFELG